MPNNNENTQKFSEEIIFNETSLLDTEEKKITKTDLPNNLPVLPVRDIVIFSHTILPLFVGRDASIQAVNAAINGSRHMLVLTQKDEHQETPAPEDLYRVGTVVSIMRMLKLPDGRLKLLVQGVDRARAIALTKNEKYLEAEIVQLKEVEDIEKTVEIEAMMRAARDQSEQILSLRGLAVPEALRILAGVDHPGKLADLIASNLRLDVEDAQHILEQADPIERLRLVNTLLAKEAEVVSMQAVIQESAREGMDKAQREYYLREQIKAIRKELGEGMTSEEEENEELAIALKKAKLPPEVKKEADKQLRRLASMHMESSEASVLRSYLEWISELPWSKLTKDSIDIPKADKILENDHYGLEKIKDRILEFLSIRKLNPKSKSPIICFAGPPGVGKTSLGRSIAKALGRKFERISLGGMRDEAEIRGHRRTYVGALPGRIIQSLKQAKTRNPVIMLDEIDKLGNDFRGDPSSALLEVLDPEQNVAFSDHYLNLPFDLSKIMFICTANNLDAIPRPLLDRMEVIQLHGYTQREKLEIAKRYLLPRQIKDNGLKKNDVVLSDAVIDLIISQYTREAGVRTLERELGTLCRKLARRKAEGEKKAAKISVSTLHTYLGIAKYLDEDLDTLPLAGIAIGLAWTPFGGEVLNVEVSTMQGKGGVTLTGQLGDVMKESAQAAISYARSHAQELGIDPEFHSHLDIHVHVPAGATPKDGPSAGVTLTTALISALSGNIVDPTLCMTGEITLRGRVLPVGGIKEKILAAVARGLKNAIIPRSNVRDLEDIPKDLLDRIDIHPVDTLEDVMRIAFTQKPKKTKKAPPKASPGKVKPLASKRNKETRTTEKRVR